MVPRHLVNKGCGCVKRSEVFVVSSRADKIDQSHGCALKSFTYVD